MNRAEQILKSVVRDEDLVELHEGWGYNIKVPFNEIHKIGLIEFYDRYELSLYYGDTQRQSQAFYAANPDIGRLSDDWIVHGNFHFSDSYGKGLIWFGSTISADKYVSFWKKNTGILHKHSITEVGHLITRLAEYGVIELNKDKVRELNDTIFEKNYSALNIGAGLGVINRIPKSKIENDSLTELKKLLVTKINEGLRVIGKNGNSFLIDIDYDNKELSEQGDPIGF